MGKLHEIYVPPTGPLDAKIIILGESPGVQEVEKRVPFVGPSGKLLDDLLHAGGIKRRDVYITNTVKFLPEGNKDEYFFQSGAPTKAYMDGIIELVGELNSLPEKTVIVPMGNYALWALTQKFGITNYRGSILESTLIKGLKVIPSIHPAYYYRSFAWHELSLSEWDFQRIAEESKTKELNLPNPEIIIDPTPEQIEWAIEHYTKADHITTDTEWYNPDTLAYISFCSDEDQAITIPATSMLAYRAFKAILGSDVPKTYQNAMFDAVALYRRGIKVNNVVDDTMVAWNCCWADIRKKDLGTLASVLTRYPYYKDELKFVGEDEERGQIYCATDSLVTETAMREMKNNEFPITGGKAGYDISMSVMNTFINAAQVGIRVDVDRLMELKAEYLEKADEIEDEVSEKVGHTVNCRSWQQISQVVYDDMGMGDKSKGTAQDVLMDMAASMSDNPRRKEEHDLLTKIIRVRQNRNIVSRYITEKIVDTDGRTRSNWNLAGTRSGRLSTTIPWWNGVALQTVPDDAREVCIPDPGNIFVGWDLEQAEARVVAVLTHDYELLEDMDSGIDIHVKLAAQLPFNLTYDEIMAMCVEKGKDNVHQRFLAKKTRHGMNYVLTWVGLKRSINREYIDTLVGVDAAMAKILRNGYLEASPGLEAWWEKVYRTVKEDGALTNCFGRKRIFLGHKTKYETLHREAVSYEPQSTVADLTTTCIAEVAKKMPWGTVHLHMHDGGLIEVPEERRDEALEILQKTMTKEIRVENQFLTIPVEVKAGHSWKDMRKVTA